MLPYLLQQLHAVTTDVESAFGALTADQLNWKPDASQWSIAQCLEHLIVINGSYFPVFERIERGQFTPTLKERLPLLPRVFGPLILKAVSPESPRRYKTAAPFQPSSSALGGDIVARFVAHQREVARHLEAAADLHPERLVITSPVASFVTYSLLDAFRILVAHEQRHLAQARRVKSLPAFPGAAGGR
jgi:hypothetical protein